MGKEIDRLSLSVKLNILEEFERGDSTRDEIVEKFGIRKHTLSCIVHDRVCILRAGQLRKPGIQLQRRQAKYDNIEEKLAHWLHTSWDSNARVSAAIVKEKAEEIGIELGHDNFRASDVWIVRFKGRNDIGQRVIESDDDDNHDESSNFADHISMAFHNITKRGTSSEASGSVDGSLKDKTLCDDASSKPQTKKAMRKTGKVARKRRSKVVVAIRNCRVVLRRLSDDDISAWSSTNDIEDEEVDREDNEQEDSDDVAATELLNADDIVKAIKTVKTFILAQPNISDDLYQSLRIIENYCNSFRNETQIAEQPKNCTPASP